jgi:hypothetical protein
MTPNQMMRKMERLERQLATMKNEKVRERATIKLNTWVMTRSFEHRIFQVKHTFPMEDKIAGNDGEEPVKKDQVYILIPGEVKRWKAVLADHRKLINDIIKANKVNK